LSEIPTKLLHKRVLLALPFCIFFAIFDLILLKKIAFFVGNLPISYGFLSFLTILLRTYLCVTAVLILISTTKLSDSIYTLKSIYVPDIFLLLFELTYRYIGILLEEVATMKNAYLLRSKTSKILVKHSGVFLGTLILRSFSRAERIFYAMKCRGYSYNFQFKSKNHFQFKDFLYLFAVSAFCIILLIRGH
jgi:cobalt/nickel transport system permease protein